jgi:hypothetical protein
MVVQYPHLMTVGGAITDSTTDVNGNWVQGTVDNDIAELQCRYETADGNGYVTGAGGAQLFYQGIVYLPLPVNTIEFGAKVTVRNNSEVIAKDTVKHFSRGQLNARVWL